MGFNGDLYPTAGASVVMTTKGDMVDYDTERQRLGIGSTGQVLTVASSLPTWATLTTADSVLTTQGDVLYESASGLARLGFGTSGDVLTTKGTGANPVWETPSGGANQFLILSGIASNNNYDELFFPLTAGSNQFSANESYVNLTIYLAFTIQRHTIHASVNSMDGATVQSFRDDGSTVGSVTITASTTGEYDSGSISVSVSSGSVCNILVDTTASSSGNLEETIWGLVCS